MADVTDVCKQLVAWLELVHSPTVNREQRRSAQKQLDDFSESSNSAQLVTVGLQMAQTNNEARTRHFGLQLVQKFVQHLWNEADAGLKLSVKDSMVMLVSLAKHPLIEENIVKNGVAKVFVEMIKREWPQQWPSLVDELVMLQGQGDSQTELVLLILLRLAEDTVEFVVMSPQRRKEVRQGLVASLPQLFQLFIRVLQVNYEAARKPTDSQQQALHYHMARTCLKTMVGFLDWVPVEYITAQDHLLLQWLCKLLSDNYLQLDAAECILSVVNKKGKGEEKCFILILFTADAMQIIFAASNSAVKSMDGPNCDSQYLFLTKLCEILTALGTQLCALLSSPVLKVAIPDTMPTYLAAILEMHQHPSYKLRWYAQTLWVSMFKCKTILNDSAIHNVLPNVLQSTYGAMSKPASDYPFIQLDFDDNIELHRCFVTCRMEASTTLTYLAQKYFDECLEFVEQKLDALLATSNNLDMCEEHDKPLQDWNTFSVFSTSIVRKIDTKNPPERGAKMLSKVISLIKACKNPVVVSQLLSSVSSLMNFSNGRQGLLAEVLALLLDILRSWKLSEIPSQSKQWEAVNALHKHTSAIFGNVSSLFAATLVQRFDELYTAVRTLLPQLYAHESVALMDSLVCISNEFVHHDMQKAVIDNFFNDFVTPVYAEIRPVLVDKGSLVRTLSLNTSEPQNETEIGNVRKFCRQVRLCVRTVHGAMKNTRLPSEPAKLVLGGYVCADTGGTRHPAQGHVLAMLPDLLTFHANLLEVILSDGGAQTNFSIHPSFQGGLLLKMSDREKEFMLNQQLGGHSVAPATEKTNVDKLRAWCVDMFEANCHILALSCAAFPREVFSFQGIVPVLIRDLHCLPYERIKFILYPVATSAVTNCPDTAHPLLFHILIHLCNSLLDRLNTDWQSISVATGNSHSSGQSEESEIEQAMKEQRIRIFSRDFVKFVASLIKKPVSYAATSNGTSTPQEDEGSGSQGKTELLSQEVTTLGTALLSDSNTCAVIVRALFTCIQWPDSTTCQRAFSACLAAVRQLVDGGNMTSLAAHYVMQSILDCLKINGHDDASLGPAIFLGTHAYAILLPLFPEIFQILMTLVESNEGHEQCVREFSQNLVDGKLNIRQKKSTFKKIVDSVIGTSLSEKFKNTIKFRDLPPLQFAKPEKTNNGSSEDCLSDISGLFKNS